MMSKKILVVDNHPLILKFMTKLLVKQGHQVVTAGDGLSALDVLKSFTPDMIFMDLIMPNIDGRKLCRIISKTPELKHAYLVILSAIAAEEAIELEDLGAHACIAKGPFDQMAHYIQAVMERAEGEGTRPSKDLVLGLENVHAREITKELLSVRRHFELVLGSMAEGILEITSDARIVYANPVALTLLGVPEEELLATSLAEQFEGKDRERIQQLLHDTGEVPQVVPDSSPLNLKGRQVALKILPVHTEASRAIIILADVTHRKRLEAQLLQAQKLEALGALAGGIARNFNNVLTAIVGNISLAIIEARPGDKILEKLEEAERASLKAKDLVDQLLPLSKGDEPVKRVTSMADLVKDVCVSILKGSNVHCEFSFPVGLWSVGVDVGQMRQAIYNLIINAVQVMPGGGTIRISAGNLAAEHIHDLPIRAGKYLHLAIQDQGSGIPAEHLSKIFDPYFTTKQTGSGLGLAAVYSIISKHQGFITVDSQPDVGTVFDVYLPALDAEGESRKSEAAELFSGKGKILVMDDEEMVREVAEQMLEYLGYTVVFAKDGREALGLYQEAVDSGQPFALVIMDLTVPFGLGGKETMQELLKIDPQVKAIVSSGYSNDPVLAKYRECGFAEVLGKPYRISELGAAVHKVITGAGEGLPPNSPGA
jgi:two-component system, cell cycle sensor histidine kinase and response regulator CckA